jgi:hypothetical protein
VSLNNEKICCESSEDKIAFCEKTAGLRRGKFSDSNSACLKVSVPVKIFQFQDMLNESERYQDAANGLKLDSENAANDHSVKFKIYRASMLPIAIQAYNDIANAIVHPYFDYCRPLWDNIAELASSIGGKNTIIVLQE